MTVAYTYDAYGQRVGKTVTTKTYRTHSHDYAATVVEPTCTEGGYTNYVCDCGDSYTGDETEALGHDYVETAEGIYTRCTCTRCGDTYTTHEHSYTTEVISPTCTEGGYTSHVCDCGDHYEDHKTPALGHDYYVSQTSVGKATYVCRRCGNTYTGVIGEIPVDPDRPVVMSVGESNGAEATQAEGELISTITEEYVYTYANGRLLREAVTTTDGEASATQTMDFFYDANGTPYALKYNGTVYYYITNLQGDVTHLVDANGTPAATYEYDPYGNVISAEGTLAEANPIRYRGYYYDTETGLYYLQSRYYDPAVGRFINADGYASTGQGIIGHNAFAYCNNNPIIYIDTTGMIPVVDSFIHREVLKEIHAKNPELSYQKTCVRYRDESGEFTGKWGFCDLYNVLTGEVWELKKNSNSKSCRTVEALNQLEQYTKGSLLWRPDLLLKKPSTTTIPSGQFTRETLYCTYKVNYWSEGNGILRYDYSISVDAGKVVQTVVIVGIAVFLGVAPFGASAGMGVGGLLPA